MLTETFAWLLERQRDDLDREARMQRAAGDRTSVAGDGDGGDNPDIVAEVPEEEEAVEAVDENG